MNPHHETPVLNVSEKVCKCLHFYYFLQYAAEKEPLTYIPIFDSLNTC